MKTSELNKIMKGLNLQKKFKKKGRLAYYTLKHNSGAVVLVGLYLDRSLNPDIFYVYYFAQCLYEPFCTYNFSLGNRIGNCWDVNSVPQLQERINNFDVFDGLSCFDDFMRLLENHPFFGNKTGRNVYFALTYYILGEYDKSLHYLNEIISLRREENNKLYFQEIENALTMKSYIMEKKYNEGITQILQWQDQTIKELGLKL